MNRFWIVLVVAGLAGCGGAAKRPELLTEQQQVYAGLSLEEISGRGEAALRTAREQELNIYAPRRFGEIEKAAEKVRAAVKRENRKSAMEEAIRGEQLLAEGQKIKSAVKTELSEELRLHASLRKQRADQSFPKDYQKLTSQLGDLIVKVEDGKAEKVLKDKQSLNASLVALEVRVIRHNALHEVESLLADAKKKGAEKLAPLTLREAMTSFQAADVYIQQNPHDEPGVAAKSKEAMFAVQHALRVADAVRNRSEMKLTGEQLVREEEQRLLSIGQALGHEDVRDRALSAQVDALVAAVRETAAASSSAEGAAKALQGAKQELAEEKARALRLETELAAAERESGDLRAEARTAGVLRARVDDLEKAKAGLERDNEQLRADAGALRVRVSELEKSRTGAEPANQLPATEQPVVQGGESASPDKAQ